MKLLHPLINQKSKHYNTGAKTAIEILEEELTVLEMIGFCKGNIFKYEYRKEHKGAKEDDEYKIYTYKQYLSVLELLIGYDKSNGHLTVKQALSNDDIQFRYS